MNEIEKKIVDLSNDKQDVEKDLTCSNGLRELNYQFTKDKKEIEFLIYRLSHECGKHHRTLNEIEQEQIRLKKHIVSQISFAKSLSQFSFLGRISKS